MASEEKYKAGKDETSSPLRENVRIMQCQKCLPDRGNYIYTAVILVLGIIAIIAGTYLGRGTIQSMEDYNFPVNDAFGNRIGTANFLSYFMIAAIYIPAGNTSGDYLGSSTQTFMDFESNLTSTIDMENNLCFIRPLDESALGSFDNLKDALLKNKQIVNQATLMSSGKVKVMNASYELVMQLKHNAKGECASRKGILSVLQGAPAPGPRINCKVTKLPLYSVKTVNGKNLVVVTEIHEIKTFCKGK